MDYRLLGRAMSYKTLMLMYFASGVFLLMLWDLVWAREGAASMTTLWQVFLLAVLLVGAHFCCYEEGILPRVPARVKRVLHLVVTYLVVLAELFLFGWAPRPTFGIVLAATGIFLAAYAALWLAFYVYYRAQKELLNERLERYKNA